MIEELLVTVLGPLVSGEVYPNTAPEDASSTRITYTLIVGASLNDLSGTADLRNSRFQIDVWHADYSALKTLVVQVRAAMKAASFTNVPISEREFYDSDVKLYRIAMDYSVWHI